MRKHLPYGILLLLAILWGSCQRRALTECPERLEEVGIIPQPKEISLYLGDYVLSDTLKLKSTGVAKELLPDLIRHLREALGRPLILIKEGERAVVSMEIRPLEGSNPEAYSLEVGEKGISLIGNSPTGLIYAAKSLEQLRRGAEQLPYTKIVDEPRLGYRGIHLDVSRHFMEKNFILKLLDEMARYKLNTFHWHLVDGGGWRMESQNYPMLQLLSTKRTEKDWDKWWQGDRRFIPISSPEGYGGSYTREDMLEVVRYAEALGITVIPEIELPGHSNELFSAYPELSCKGYWTRNASEVCLGKEETFTFFENILDEVMAIFPSKYIHIGGDEADKTEWKNCPNCQKRIKDNNLKDEEELQSYAIKRIERYLNEHGREIIGWDEILEGGLAPGATVMSWRGEDGGIAAAKAGHDVIMTPSSHLYLDYYQADPFTEPKAIGGYVPLEKVYSYNPVSDKLTTDAERQHVIGVQGNLWTEYVDDEKAAEYMLFPRLLAVAEVGWTPQEKRSYEDFLRRVNWEMPHLKEQGINVYPLKNIAITDSVDHKEKCVWVSIKSERIPAEIRYTLDGSKPTKDSPLYTKPIEVREEAKIVAQLFEGDEPLFEPVRFQTGYHLAVGATVSYKEGHRYAEKYAASGDGTLTDGLRGGPTYLDGRWQGFLGEDVDVTLDLGAEKPLQQVALRFLQSKGNWVYMPREVILYISQDGKKWQEVGRKRTVTSPEEDLLEIETFAFPVTGKMARYLRLTAENGRGADYWLFTDELVVY